LQGTAQLACSRQLPCCAISPLTSFICVSQAAARTSAAQACPGHMPLLLGGASLAGLCTDAVCSTSQISSVFAECSYCLPWPAATNLAWPFLTMPIYISGVVNLQADSKACTNRAGGVAGYGGVCGTAIGNGSWQELREGQGVESSSWQHSGRKSGEQLKERAAVGLGVGKGQASCHRKGIFL